MKLARSTFCIHMLALVLVLTSVVACGSPWRDGYYKKGVGRLTQDEISEKMGPPHTAKTPALGGDTIWTYRVSYSDKELDPMDFSGLSTAASEAAIERLGNGGLLARAHRNFAASELEAAFQRLAYA